MTEQAKANAGTARAIIELYDRMKIRLIELTHSQHAVPLLDRLFDQPIFQSSHLTRYKQMPSIPTVLQMLRRLRKAGILTDCSQGQWTPRSKYLHSTEVLNPCEGEKVI